jgi:hypothetical protein
MATTTPNFGWSVPTSSDLVKNGATAIETLGDSIDASLVDLKGGTTGQVLSKASNTDMDFTWVTDAAGMTNPMTTTGDTIYSSSGSTPARLGLGTAGQVLQVNSGATAPEWATPAAGATTINKNYLINGGFAISQRGTSFVSGANNNDAYTLDRWYILSDTNDVIDVTQDTTTVPTNGQFAIALDVETANKKFGIATIIENKDVIGLVGNTVTFSFKAKVSSTTKLDNVKAAIVAWSGTADTVTSDIISAWGAEGTNPTLIANATYENSPANLSVTTSYATYSVSAAVDTASTKNLILFVWSDVTDTTAGDFLYIAESKLELGSTATAFVYAGGTIQGELAACQRYYVRTNSAAVGNFVYLTPFGSASSAAQAYVPFTLPVVMRVAPTTFDYSNIALSDGATLNSTGTWTLATTSQTDNQALVGYGTLGGAATLTAFRPYFIQANNNSAAYVGFSAEL